MICHHKHNYLNMNVHVYLVYTGSRIICYTDMFNYFIYCMCYDLSPCRLYNCIDKQNSGTVSMVTPNKSDINNYYIYIYIY